MRAPALSYIPQSITAACRLCVEGVHACEPGQCGCSVCARPAPPSRPPLAHESPAYIRRTETGTQVILLNGPYTRDFLAGLLPAGSRRPIWNPEGWWELPGRHFDRVLTGLVNRFGEVQVYDGDEYSYTAVRRKES